MLKILIAFLVLSATPAGAALVELCPGGALWTDPVTNAWTCGPSTAAPTPIPTRWPTAAPTPEPTKWPTPPSAAWIQSLVPTPLPTAWPTPPFIPTQIPIPVIVATPTAVAIPTPIPTAWPTQYVPPATPTPMSAVYDPASLAANSLRCDTVTVTGAIAGNPIVPMPQTTPPAGCVMSIPPVAIGANQVRVCWRNVIASTTACDVPSSTWLFRQP